MSQSVVTVPGGGIANPSNQELPGGDNGAVDVIKKQRERQQAAREILTDLDLERRWSQFARPTFVGAMSYGLMVAPDIDMEIFHDGKPPIDEAFAVMAACAKHHAVRKVRFSNHLDGADEGIYWQLRVPTGGEDWKIDMWLLREGHPGPLSSWPTDPMRAAPHRRDATRDPDN